MATCGLSTGAGKVYEILQKEIEGDKLPVKLSQRVVSDSAREEPVVGHLDPGQKSVLSWGDPRTICGAGSPMAGE